MAKGRGSLGFLFFLTKLFIVVYTCLYKVPTHTEYYYRSRKEKVMKTPMEIVSDYTAKARKLKDMGSQHKEIQPLSVQEVLFIRATLHPTAKKESKEVTRKLINYLCDRGICTAQEIYHDLGYVDKPVLHRLKKFREHGLVRRESKKYYLPTLRMLELKEKYLERICGE